MILVGALLKFKDRSLQLLIAKLPNDDFNSNDDLNFAVELVGGSSLTPCFSHLEMYVWKIPSDCCRNSFVPQQMRAEHLSRPKKA